MSTVQTQKSEQAQQVPRQAPWQADFLKSVLKTRFVALSRADNLSKKIKEMTQDERIQIKAVQSSIAAEKANALSENKPYKSVLEALKPFESRIKEIRAQIAAKTIDERKERTQCVKVAKRLDQVTAQNINADPRVDVLPAEELQNLMGA